MVDWRFFDLAEPQEAEPTGNWLRVGPIVASASANPPGVQFQSAVRCVESQAGSGRRRCLGFLFLRRTDVPSEIRSECARCGAKARLVHWRKTPWDLSDWTGYQLDEVNVRLTASEYELLTSCATFDRAAQIAVFRARPESQAIRVRATLEQSLHLQDRLAAETALETNARRKARLHRVYAKIERAIPIFRQFSPDGPRFAVDESSPASGVTGILDRLESKALDLVASDESASAAASGLPDDSDWSRLKERLASEPLPELSGLSLREISRIMWHSRHDGDVRLAADAQSRRLMSRSPAIVYARGFLRGGIPAELERSPGVSPPDVLEIAPSVRYRFRSRAEREMASRFVVCLGDFLREQSLATSTGSPTVEGRALATPTHVVDLYWVLLLKTMGEVQDRLMQASDPRRRYRLMPLWLYLLKYGASEEIDSVRFSRSMNAFSRLMAPELPQLIVERIWVGLGLPSLVALGLVTLRGSQAGSSPLAIRPTRLLSHGIRFEEEPASPSGDTD